MKIELKEMMPNERCTEKDVVFVLKIYFANGTTIETALRSKDVSYDDVLVFVHKSTDPYNYQRLSIGHIHVKSNEVIAVEMRKTEATFFKGD